MDIRDDIAVATASVIAHCGQVSDLGVSVINNIHTGDGEMGVGTYLRSEPIQTSASGWRGLDRGQNTGRKRTE